MLLNINKPDLEAAIIALRLQGLIHAKNVDSASLRLASQYHDLDAKIVESGREAATNCEQAAGRIEAAMRTCLSGATTA